MNSSQCSKVIAGVVLAAGVAVAAAQDHPFRLVNVVDLFELHSIDNFDNEFDPVSQEPAGYADYLASPRIGTNPGVVTVSGDRAWIGGYNNNADFNAFTGTDEGNRAAWYASVGVAEVNGIGFASGFGAETFVRYPGTFQVGPGLRISDWVSGMDYDPNAMVLYVAFDANVPSFPFILPDPSLDWTTYETYLAAVDANPESPTYAQVLWLEENPLTGTDEDRIRAGVAVDPLAPNWIGVPRQGLGQLDLFDVTDLAAGIVSRQITDVAALQCNSTAFRGHDFHPETGEWFGRVLNGIQYVPRDTRTTVAPFATFPLFIVEGEGGDGLANTTAAGDDDQLIAVGAAAAPGENVIGVGDNGVLDTQPEGDDLFTSNALITERILGNNPATAECALDPDGFPAGSNPQGQGIAIIPASNLADATEDLLLANNRPTFGSGMETEIKFFGTDGTPMADLPIPCAPLAGENTGIAMYDMDYDAESGTLVVLEFERRLLFVYRAELVDGEPVPKFDFTRNGALDLADFAGFQDCFTGAGNVDGLSLNCLRMNADSDCDVDIVDFAAFEAAFLTGGA